MALTQGKKVEERDGKQSVFPVAAGAVGYQGGLVMLVAGVARKAAPGPDAATVAGYQVVGIAERAFTGGQADGAVGVPARTGVFGFKNSTGADQITLSSVGQPAYVVDDETVAKTSNTSLRPKAGIIRDVTASGFVFVRVNAQA